MRSIHMASLALSTLTSRPHDNLASAEDLLMIATEADQELAKKVSAHLPIIPALANVVVAYAQDTSLRNWHIALERLLAIPPTIPPLQLTIDEIRNTIYSTPGSFYLIPHGTLNELEALVNAYGQKNLVEFGGENPLRFRFAGNWTLPSHRNAFGKIQGDLQWIWMSDDILEGSLAKHYQEQTQMIAQSGANFQIPSLRETAVALLLRKIATGESLLPQAQKGLNRYTRVEEVIQGKSLMLGNFTSSGIHVSTCTFDTLRHHEIGVLRFRKL